MKRGTLFEHKKIIFICEENMGDTNEYQKLLEPPTKQEKVNARRKTYVIYGQHNIQRHFQEHCHWNLNNLNTKLKDKMEVAMNGVS